MQQTFPKKEKLKSKKDIGLLFSKGKAITIFPIRLLFVELKDPKDDMPFKVGVSVSKRLFKRAVDRNLIKRRMREAYRLNKSLLSTEKQSNTTYFNIAFVYIGNEIVDSSVIHSKLKKAMEKLKEDWNHHE